MRISIIFLLLFWINSLFSFSNYDENTKGGAIGFTEKPGKNTGFIKRLAEGNYTIVLDDDLASQIITDSKSFYTILEANLWQIKLETPATIYNIGKMTNPLLYFSCSLFAMTVS